MRYNPTDIEKITFIYEIAPLAQKAYAVLGKVLPSICIGMACVESGFGYGTDGSRLMYKNNAVLGQKVGSGKTATKYWNGKAYSAKTSEEYTLGVHTNITDKFRKYDNLEQCIFNYYELLNTSLYKKVTANVDYATQMKQIKSAGYMTSSTEVNSVISIIKQYNLTQFDNLTIKIHETDYIPGNTYVLHSNLYIRDKAAGEKIDFFKVTANAKANGYADAKGKAVLRKGSKVTCKDAVKINGNIWIQIPSGWVCAKEGDKTYIL